MTVRIAVTKSSPTTEFQMEADRVGQSIEGNYTIVRCRMKCINRGDSTSFSNWYGRQKISINTHWSGATKSGTPFLPSGYAHDAVRWNLGNYDIQIPHGDDGKRGAITLRMELEYGNGNVDEAHTFSFNDFPDIPRGPRLKAAGVWKNSLAYVKAAGIWKIALPYVKVSGLWKIGGG